MKKKLRSMALLSAIVVSGIFAGCGDSGINQDEDMGAAGGRDETEYVSEIEGGIAPSGGEIFDDTTIIVFADESLSALMNEIVIKYQELRPTVSVQEYYDDAQAIGTRLGGDVACDIVFLAAGEQPDMLQTLERLAENTGYYVIMGENGQMECLPIEDAASEEGAEEIVYAFAQVTNREADELERDAAYDFVQFLISDTTIELYGR